MSLLTEGRNCWRIVRASRFAFLVDGQEYFGALVKAFRTARRSIDILAWDVNSRVELMPERGEHEKHKFGPLLQTCMRENRDLVVRLLVWSPPVIYGVDRQHFMARAFRKLGDRLRFEYDDQQPMGASQHQKIVVIDGLLAFAGGMDPTAARWDTREHRKRDPRRRHPRGWRYHVSHDVQVAVTGQAAVALAEVVQDRWRRANGAEIAISSDGPEPNIDIPWQIHNARIGIARTYPPFKDRPEVCESCTLYRDLIAAGKQFIFIENQYFTSSIITDAVEASLRKPEGPQIYVVIPKRLRDGTANVLLDVLRRKRLHQLRQADTHGRFHALYPGLRRYPMGVYLHSKVMVIDDEYVVVGSSNCSDRSMGIDSECDLVVDAEDRPEVKQAIADFREGLLAEHSGLSLETFRAALKEAGSLPLFLEKHMRNKRSLRTFKNRPLRPWEKWLANLSLVDTAQPTMIDRLIDTADNTFLQREPTMRIRQLLIVYGFLMSAIIVVASLWWGIRQPETAGFMHSLFMWARSSPGAPLVAIALFVAAGALLIPYNALTFIVATLFAGPIAIFITLMGATLSAASFYSLGRLMGKKPLRFIFGPRADKMGELLQQPRLSTIVLLRFLPIAPFTVVNALAGAFGIPFRTFILGTLLGLAPGAIALVLFQRSLLSLVRDPDWASGLLFCAMIGLCLLILRYLRRRVRSLG